MNRNSSLVRRSARRPPTVMARRLTSREARRRRWFAPLAALLLLLGLSAALVSAFQSETKGSAAQAVVGGQFRLVDPQNHVVTDRDFRGRYLLVYFGYTSCPDVCPTTLASVIEALRLLGARSAAVQPVFITIDPEHDTPGVMGKYVANFSPRLIGLTGTPEELRAAEAAYHVTVEHRADGLSHSAVLYLMAPDGHFLAPLPADSAPGRIAAALTNDLA